MDQTGAVPDTEQAPIEMEMDDMSVAGGDSSGVTEVKQREKGERGGERGKADGAKRKECFAFGGGSGGGSSSSSSSNTGSSCSESEVEQQDRQRHIDQWNLKKAP